MSKFEKRFLTFLHEQTDEERAAMEASLDDDTDPSQFDVQASTPETDTLSQQTNQLAAQQAQQMIVTLEGWAAKLDEFAKFINEGPVSLQVILANAPPETLLANVNGSERRKLAPLATLLNGLKNAFVDYAANGNDSSLKGR